MQKIMPDEYQASKPIQVDNKTLIYYSKLFRFQKKGIPFRFNWARPASVYIQDKDGSEAVLPIQDLTLRLIVSLILICMGTLGITWLVARFTRK